MRKDYINPLKSTLSSSSKHFPTWRKLRTFLFQISPTLFTLNNLKYGIKTAIAVVISYLIALLVAPEYAFWAPISAIIVMQVNIAASVESSVDRIVGSLYGAIIGLILHFVLPPQLFFDSIGLFIIATLCALLLLWNPRYRLAGITSISIFIISGKGENIWIFSGTFMFMIILSILISVLVSVMLWPVSGADVLKTALKKQYLMAADYLDTITHSFLDSQHHLLPSYLEPLHNALSQNRPTLRKIKEFEAINLNRLYPDLDLMVSGLDLIRTYLTALLDALDSDCDSIKEVPMKEELMALSASAASGLRWIASHSADQPLPEVRWYIEASSIQLADLRESNQFKKFSHSKIIQIFAFYNAMSHLAETVAHLEEQIDILRAQRRKKRKK